VTHLSWIFVALGLVLLFFGGEALVRGAISMARRLGVSPLVISLSVVALGTSAPEMVVALDSALDGHTDVAIGNVVGSNIANTLLILGVAGLIAPIVCNLSTVRRDGVAVALTSLVFVALAWVGELRAWSGAVLLVLLTAYIGLSYWRDRRDAKALREHAEEVEEIGGRPLTLTRSLLLVAVGLVLLALGADLLVEGAVDIARHFGVSETVIGLTLVAFGTSLPELATCAIAAFHRHADVALGNILGSNMFNILGIMGVVTIVTPVPVPAQIMDFDVWFMFGISVLVLPLMITRGRLNRLESGGLVALYLAYLWAQFHGVQGLFGLIPA
jgi:cation:H+ antiporter